MLEIMCVNSTLALIVHNNPELFTEQLAWIITDFTLVKLNDSFIIECVRCHAMKYKIKNYATDKVKKL